MKTKHSLLAGARSLGIGTLKSKYPPLLVEEKPPAQKFTALLAEQNRQLQLANIATLAKGVN